ncbi:MAG: hypothetical protein NZ455_08550 [Bacteroidia bacterium]|nr:hypothetical protein [Bacteroidia bacterium]
MGVSLWAFRCAYAHKVGVLRANGAAPLGKSESVSEGFAPCLRTPFACLTQVASVLILLIQNLTL